MGSSRTLNVHTPWTEILTILGSSVDATRGLPTRVQCPLCSGPRLSIYEDTISGGAWHYCFDCHSAGDMIELVAAKWKVTHGVAIRRLVDDYECDVPTERLSPEAIENYVTRHPDYRRKLLEFFASTSKYLQTQHTPSLGVLKSKLRLESDMSKERWEAGPGKMVGGFPHVDVERVLRPGCVIDGRGVGTSRVFKGRRWRDVIVVPYHSMPEHICGFGFVGRDCESDDFVHRIPSAFHENGNKQRFEATWQPIEGGLACFWAGYSTNQSFGGYVVGVADPFLAIRMQIRHMATSTIPLPLVAYKDQGAIRTKSAWASLEHKVPVLWGWRLTPSLVYQAIVATGNLSITKLNDISQSKIDHYVRTTEPSDAIRIAVKRSKPWKEFLIEWADDSLDGVVEDLILGLEAYGVTREYLAKLSPRLAELCRVGQQTQSIKLSMGVTIVERAGRWWIRSNHLPAGINDKTLLGAIVRIDSTHLGDDGVANYHGRILCENEEFSFVYPAAKLPKDLFTLVQTTLARDKSGYNLGFDPTYTKHLFRVAMSFSGMA